MRLQNQTNIGGLIEYKGYGKQVHKKWQKDILHASNCKYGHKLLKHGQKTQDGTITYTFDATVKKDMFLTDQDLLRRSFSEQKKDFKLIIQATKEAKNIPEDGKYAGYLYQFQCLGTQRKPCLSGAPAACFAYAKELELLGKRKKAYKFHKYGCKIGSAQSCFRAASILYQAQKNKITRRSLEFYKKSCTEEYSPGCFTVADYYSRKQQIMQSLSYYKLHCNFSLPENIPIDHNQIISCFKAGEISFLRKKRPAAIEYYEKACDLRGKSSKTETLAMKACARLGTLSRNKDLLDLGIEYLHVNCNKMKNSEACYELAVIYSQDNKIKKAFNYFEKLFKSKFNDWNRINQDLMLKNIKRDPSFKRIIESYMPPIDDLI